MSIDVYIWLTYRYFQIDGPMTLNWFQMKWLFGDSIANDARGMMNFKNKFREAMIEISKFYPDAKFNIDVTNGITLFPSRPHIPILK